MPAQKYFTEEERKAAAREYQRQYRAAHPERVKGYCKKYRDTHKEAISAHRKQHRLDNIDEYRQRERERGRTQRGNTSFNEELAEEDILVETELNTYITHEMELSERTQPYNDFVELLKTKGITNEDDINAIYQACAVAQRSINHTRGRRFETIVQKVLLNIVKDSGLLVYRQVPYNDYKCLIDFVITDERVKKDDIDLSRAIVISTKTGFSSEWREDMHLYSRCKNYIMVTLNDKAPTEDLPSNVYFASPNFSTLTDHIISINSLKDLIIKAFEETS